MRALKSIFCTVLVAIGLAHAQTNTITVEIGSSRSSNDAVTTAVTLRAKKIAALTDAAKRRLMANYPNKQLSFPTRVLLTRNGVRLATRSTRAPGQITLLQNTATGFNLATDNANYWTFLNSVFNVTVNEMNRLFGQPWQAGQILVSDYDATIDDRDAVAGGIYLPDNGSGQQEIRFPEYGINSGTKNFQPDYETAAVDFVHTLLLAYQGTTPYAYDAFEEGLARAITMKIMREGLTFSPALDQTQVEAVLASTYDVYGSYDWDNQRALGGPVFIAPNLVSSSPTIPVGTFGGAYLLRFRMAGSAWYKVLSEYPLFAAQLNTMVQNSPSLASNVPGLEAAAQTILNADQPTSPNVEGMPFAQWFSQQYILQTNITSGNKVLVEVVPELPDASQIAIPDFGLFDVQTTYFATDWAGNESFPNPNGGTAYPLYLDNSFNRFSPAAQDDTMGFFLGYGSVTPNFLSSYTGGLMYRVAIDVPINDQLQRVFVPAGGVSTSLNTNTNEVYGTVSGEDPPVGGTEDVKIYCGPDLVTDAPVVNGAFGVNISPQSDAEYSISRQIEAQVWLTVGSSTPTMILDRFVDKSLTGNITPEIQEGLGLDLRVAGNSSYSLSLTAGINAIGFPIDPFSSDAPTVLGINPAQLLVARYDGITGQYLLNPSVEPFKIGHGFFVETPSATTASVLGRSSAATPTSVALEPGWNLISCPLPQASPGTQVLVYHANDLSTPLDFTDASTAGLLLGNTFFSFVPGANDPAAGYPTTGSFTAATEFLPGQAYFVQCLAPEGLVLEFIPMSVIAAEKRAPVSTVRTLVPVAPVPPVTSPPPPMSWEVHVTLQGGAGDKADCVIGMSPAATVAFNRTLDSGIPPSMGGLQLVSQNSIPLYRDFRPVSPSVAYTLVTSNLIVGQPYSMRFLPEVGNALRTTLKNPQGVTVNIARNGQFYFVANSSTETFTFTVTGVAR